MRESGITGLSVGGLVRLLLDDAARPRVNWEPRPLPFAVEAFLPSLSFVDASTAWILASRRCDGNSEDASLYVTTDFGVSWAVRAQVDEHHPVVH